MKYTYMQILVSYYAVAERCNQWVEKGWDVFSVLPSSNSSGGISDCLILFRRNEEDFARFNEELKKVRAKLPPYDKP